MPELFTDTEVQFGGAMTSQYGLITCPLFPNFGLLLQQLQINYSQQITRLYELGIGGNTSSSASGYGMHVYYISGRAQGQLTANRVVGPGISMQAFYSQFGSVCRAKDNTLQVTAAPNVCSGEKAGDSNYTMSYCVLQQVGLAISTQDFIINESATIQFVGMSVGD